MSKKPKPELIDDDNPEWTEDDFRRARPAAEVLPSELLAGLIALKKRHGERGPQKSPVKVPTTIRLSPDVMDAFKATGAGWQTRIDTALRDWLKTHSPA